MNFMNIIKTIVVFSLATVFFSCTGNGSSNANNDKNQKDDNLAQSVDNKNAGTETFYLIPSPEELFRFIQDGKLKFSASVVNPTSNIGNYINTRLKELNFGIYSADLAYVASFNKYQPSIDYLGVVRTLSDEIGISSVFDKNLLERIDKITDNRDSLLQVTNDTYISIVTYLDGTERQESLAQIVTGGWVESIYVVVNLLENYNENPKIISLLASQKDVVNNLVMYLKKRQKDANIKKTLADLEPIAKFYESLEVKKKENTGNKNETKTGDKIVVGGNKEVVMTKEQFKTLKVEITNLRNKITNP